MKTTLFTLVMASFTLVASAQTREYAPISKDIPTDTKIKSKIGTLSFPMGVPTESTAQKLEDEMLYINGVNSYNNTIQGASLWAMRKGFASVGVKRQ